MRGVSADVKFINCHGGRVVTGSILTSHAGDCRLIRSACRVERINKLAGMAGLRIDDRQPSRAEPLMHANSWSAMLPNVTEPSQMTSPMKSRASSRLVGRRHARLAHAPSAAICSREIAAERCFNMLQCK